MSLAGKSFRRLFLYSLLLVCNLCFGQVDLNLGLKAHYLFSGNANDVSGNGFNGVPQGNIQLTTDRFGIANSAYQFDGIDDGIIVAANSQLTSPAFSICYYFQTESNNLQVCVGKIDYTSGYAATFNSGVYPTGPTAFFGTMNSLNNCFLQVPTTYTYTIYSPTIINLNQWYCVVNTFENGIEKMYLDGILIKQTSQPFNDATNCSNTNLLIGSWWQGDPNRFKGKIDDVRIYDRAINEDEVRALCSATSKTDTIINEYTPVLALNICNNILDVEDASKYDTGDTVLLIQMKGAIIDSTNTSNFGTITDYKNAGNYEFNIIKQKTGNSITLLNILVRQYDIPNGKVQLIRVPFYKSIAIKNTLSCLPWDGSKGGVLAFNVEGNVNMLADMDVSEKGFSAGLLMKNRNATFNQQGYYYGPLTNNGAEKGESISTISEDKNYGRGAPANGGGGGNAHNTGGGGGANGGMGGNGGDQWITNKTITEEVGGKGGKALANSSLLKKLFLGGGGGMGQANDLFEYPAGNGGGIIILTAGSLKSNNFSIKANGGNGMEAPNALLADDGVGGGGGGGSILLDIANVTSSTNLEVKGGRGANHIANNVLQGPGGGGGGGVIALAQIVTSPLYNINLSGGSNGVNINLANNPWGATPGNSGITLNNFKPVFSEIIFKPNIDSIRINKQNVCKTFDFKGLGFTQTSPINKWSWYFGDGKTSNSQNVNYTYPSDGTFNLKLVGTDMNGCKDSVQMPVTIKSLNVTKSTDTSLCGSSPVKIFAAGGSTYSWSPAKGLSNPAVSNPVASPVVTTNYYVTVSNEDGCSKKDSVKITVNNLPVITKSKDTSICKNSQATLLAAGGSSYSWTPATSLNNPNIANPVAMPLANTKYKVLVTNSDGCSKSDSIFVKINPVASIKKSKDSTICNKASVNLFASGGSTYVWTPNSTLINSTSSTPVATPTSATVYQVKITDAYSCVYYDSVKISVRAPGVFSVSPDNFVCVNSPQQLTASGGDTYVWSPASFLDNPNISSPVATPGASIAYSVTIKESVCNESATLFTKLTAYPLPIVTAFKSNDINCSFPSSQLSATGAQNYTWSPANSLNNPNVSNPIATPNVATLYEVKGKDVNGCIGTNVIEVKATSTSNVIYELPNSFTPNGDGKNDCFGVANWGTLQFLDFSVYNRFGERVFHTNKSSVCWDGKYKGQLQDTDAFVYVLNATTACEIIERKGAVMLLR